ncbi:hypothetical protein QK289_12125 [Exiguobacterium antarcticum]|uniref:Uncharacterized protein n=1 Tax=Exiguobacterium antarcticum TaxID=132920 RepID=A0ABT6R491_9BACL|nr:hypothetical protein [Exiguobacterium antarcticum]MDI3235757.1 hypothetical protein [Exiguobacterium antarcticum]
MPVLTTNHLFRKNPFSLKAAARLQTIRNRFISLNPFHQRHPIGAQIW